MGICGPPVEFPLPPTKHPKHPFDNSTEELWWCYEWDTICLKLNNLNVDLSKIPITFVDEGDM